MPTLPGSFDDELLIPSDDPDENQILVPVSGAAVAPPEIDVIPISHDFGTVVLPAGGAQIITVTNLGGVDLSIGSIGGLAEPFLVESDTCSGSSLAPAASCILEVAFLPTGQGAYADELEIVSDDSDENPVIVTLAGEAVEEVAPSEIPTLGEWSLLLLALSLGLLGWAALRR
jgi:hypothetical protein